MTSPPAHLDALGELIARFSDDRDWSQFHNPKNLILALSAELGELAEVFQWLTPEQALAVRDPDDPLHADAVAEMADVLIYLIRLAQVLDIDLIEAAMHKMETNEAKYPIDLSRGSAQKYTAFEDRPRGTDGQTQQSPTEPEGTTS